MMKNYTTLGILGGGQLGRMSAMAAARLGIRAHIYAPEEDSPAFQVTNLITQADYTNESALKAFADQVDVISYEFENIPLETVDFLAVLKPVYPGRELLQISQNRLKEKDFLNRIGIATASWTPAHGPEDIEAALTRWKAHDCIIKTTRFGYDGKGQLKLDDKSNILNSWMQLKTKEAVIEEIIDFAYEASCVVARDAFGQCEAFPVTLNNHKNHILSVSTAPAPMPSAIADQAKDMTIKLAEAVNLRGVLALEMFVTRDGKILANEIAPRTHNSGHWTMDGCNVSQFEQHVRAVCGLPVAKIVQHSAVEMTNLIGSDVEKLSTYYEMENACVHLYGKMEARPGRKMGHVNLLKPLNNMRKDYESR